MMNAWEVLALPRVRARLARNVPRKKAKLDAIATEIRQRARRLDAYAAFCPAAVARDLYPKPERDDDAE